MSRWTATCEALADAASSTPGIACLIGGYAIVWALVGTILNSTTSLHHDMTEAWVWGQEFELGYYKHPPLMAWIVGLWFKVWPRSNWAFELLSGVNVAIGLAGVWAVARQLLEPRKALVAVLLVAVMPFSNLMALKFNANSAQFAIWPWVVWSFMRALDTRGLAPAVLFGILSGLAMLTKYYAATLLISCFAASLLSPNRNAYYRSAAPYLTVGVFVVVMAPHLWWMATSGASTLAYALDKANHPFWPSAKRGLEALGISLAYMLPACFALAYAVPDKARSLPLTVIRRAFARENLWLTVLALGPLALTLLTVLATVRISSQFLIPAFFMLPVGTLLFSDIDGTTVQIGRLFQFVATATLVVLAASPVVAGLLAFAIPDERYREPRVEAAHEATRLWHAAYDRPLRIVAGNDRYARAISFYSPDGPSQFIEFDKRRSPWITEERITREGMIIVCETKDEACVGKAASYPSARRSDVRLVSTAWGVGKEERALTFTLVPPRR